MVKEVVFSVVNVHIGDALVAVIYVLGTVLRYSFETRNR